MGTIIEVNNISKQYRLGQVGTGTLSHDINRWWHRIRGNQDPYLKIGEENDRTKKGETDYAWALKDINFGVGQGEVLGIIGRNGAGKSTLLKILSRTTAPTTGQIRIKGRIASLLEVGTGFHPELTGRENVFLNGAILGMTKSEIKRKFDEIVDFSGVERYIDTPVKRYSSGMYVRLAFGVAAHLEPEILIVDEVLAVGDVEFQKKALGKMQDVSLKDGRTVLFVSHNMGAIQNLCNKSILLERGRIKTYDVTEKVINEYLRQNVTVNKYSSKESKDVQILEAKLEDDTNNEKYVFSCRDRIRLVAKIKKAGRNIGPCNFSLTLLNNEKRRVFSNTYVIDSMKDGVIVEAIMPSDYLSMGNFSFSIALDIPNQILFDHIEDVLNFEIIDKPSYLSSYSSFTGDVICKIGFVEK